VALSVTFFFASGQTTSLLNAARRDGYAAGTASAGFGATAIASLLVAPVGGAAGVALARAAGELSRLALEMIGVARTGLVETRRVLAVWGAVAPVMIGAGLAVVSGWDIVWTAAGIVIGALGGLVAGRAVLRRMGVELSRDGLST
jgi:O-antigen/teichoic acid export membrane protein